MNSLENSITPSSIKPEILLSLNSPVGKDKIWILVEGETDIQVYTKFFKKESVNLKSVPGASGQITDTVAYVRRSTNQVIGIKDADFDRLNNKEESPNIFLTDQHDLEMMMIHSDQVLYNLSSEYSFEGDILTIRDEIIHLASFIGYVRWFDNQNSFNILFKGLGFGSFYDGTNGFKTKKFLAELNKRPSEKTRDLDAEEINLFIENHRGTDLFQLCNGHDTSSLFSIRLSSNVKYKKTGKEDFHKSLRLSYRKDDFKQTGLYTAINSWAVRENFDLFTD